MKYKLIKEDWDTRINVHDDEYAARFNGEGFFDTFEEAQQEAIKYLEDHIKACQKTLEWIRDGK